MDSNTPRAMIILPIDLVSFIFNSLPPLLWLPQEPGLFFELRSLIPGYLFAPEFRMSDLSDFSLYQDFKPVKWEMLESFMTCAK
jgi:hypothetical protein